MYKQGLLTFGMGGGLTGNSNASNHNTAIVLAVRNYSVQFLLISHKNFHSKTIVMGHFEVTPQANKSSSAGAVTWQYNQDRYMQPCYQT